MRARLVVAVAVWATVTVVAQRSAPVGEWRHYGGDAASSRYSPLDQINLSNVSGLEIAWRWPSPDNPIVKANPLARPGGYEDTPLMVNGVLYTATSLGCSRRSIQPAGARSGSTIPKRGGWAARRTSGSPTAASPIGATERSSGSSAALTMRA